MKPHKVGFKSRSGRKRSPTTHGNHRRKTSGSRPARILRARLREAFAPRASDFEAEQMVLEHARPLTSAVVTCGLSADSQNRGRGADKPGRTTQRSLTSDER
jgi:hypothetical protein